MNVRAALKELEKGVVRPVYVAYGPETFILNEYIGKLVRRLVDPELKDFAVSRYDLAETPLDVVLDDAETLPFMADRKVVIASGAVFLTGAKDASKVEHRTDRLLEYLRSPVETAVVLLTVSADKLDERKKLVKTLKEKDCLLSFQALSAEELTDWVAERAASRKVSFAPGAAERLLLYAGTHLQTLSMELEKLALYAGAGGIVTADLVEQLTVRSSEQNVFILIEELVHLRKDRALTMLYELLKQREEPIKIIVLMARQFRMILQVKELQEQGYSQQQIAGQIGAHPYAVKLAAEQGRRYDRSSLTAILARLAEADYGIKSGAVDKVMALEMFMLSLPGEKK